MNKNPVCPYCGGAIRIVVCDDEGNIKSDPETYLKNPWSGLTYGIQHDLKDVPEGYSCPIASFDEDNQLMGTRLYDTENDAYNALRSRRKPLELNQIFRKCVFIETALGGSSEKALCYPAYFNPYQEGYVSGALRNENFVGYKTFESDALYLVNKDAYGKSWRCWETEPTLEERECAGWLGDPWEAE